MRKIFLTLTVITLVAGLSGCTNEPVEGGEELTDAGKVELAQCLTDKGAKMYGAVWCSHCTAQKKAFGDAFQYINYIECDANTNLETAKLCVEADLDGVPTWEFADGSRQAGNTPLQELAKLAGC